MFYKVILINWETWNIYASKNESDTLQGNLVKAKSTKRWQITISKIHSQIFNIYIKYIKMHNIIYILTWKFDVDFKKMTDYNTLKIKYLEINISRLKNYQ